MDLCPGNPSLLNSRSIRENRSIKSKTGYATERTMVNSSVPALCTMVGAMIRVQNRMMDAIITLPVSSINLTLSFEDIGAAGRI